jgi:hypothetical protein
VVTERAILAISASLLVLGACNVILGADAPNLVSADGGDAGGDVIGDVTSEAGGDAADGGVQQGDAPAGDAPDAVPCTPPGLGLPDEAGAFYVDISAGKFPEDGYSPQAAIDPIHKKLLVVTEDGANMHRPALFRCGLDGSCCAYADISAGAGAYSGVDPSALVDRFNQKLLALGRTPGNNNGDTVRLFRCELDGTACTATTIDPGEPGTSTQYRAAIDETNHKLVVIVSRPPSALALLRCELDGSGCSSTELLSVHYFLSWMTSPALALDPANARAIVAINGGVFRCGLDGGGCTYSDLSDAGVQPGAYSVAVDDVNRWLFVHVVSSSQGLFRCDVSTLGCVYVDLSAIGTNGPVSPIVDVDGGEFVLAGQFTADPDAGLGTHPALLRCRPDATGCVYVSAMAGWVKTSDGPGVSAVLDEPNRRILVVTPSGPTGMNALNLVLFGL